jgi:CPA1 family monovalent cation:H+ antiporter
MSGWTAMRGVVSLATALALPLTTASGEPLARERSARAALERLDAVSQEDWIPPSDVANARACYERRLQRFVPDAELDPSCTGDFAQTQRRLRATAIAAGRHELIRMRNRGEISDEVLHEVERELDVEALRQGIGHVVSSPAP